MRILVFFLLQTLFLSAQADGNFIDYYRAKVQPGDGVYSFLRRFDLDSYPCNHKRFYELNKLKKGAELRAGEHYFLPILLYKYNGKSIRSTIGKNDWDQAVRIESFNKLMLRKDIKTASFKKDKELWVPYHELNCPGKPAIEIAEVEAVNKSKSPRHFDIFGEKYGHTPLIDKSLKGQVFYVISGHGGPDPGALGKRGKHQLCEDEYAYDVSLRLVRKLIERGATAYMIVRDNNDGIRDGSSLKCDSDEVVWGNKPIPLSQKDRLFQRSDLVNKLYAKHKKQGVKSQKAIVLHVDYRGRKHQTDVFFYYASKRKDEKKTAKNIHKTFKQKYHELRKNRAYTGTVSKRDLHMLRECKPNTVYVELGNISHPQDQKRIILKSNRELLAEWLMEGLIR